MKEQSFANHTRLVPGFHFLTLSAVLVLLVASVIHLFSAAKDDFFSAALICLIALIIASFSWYLRTFALKAQDRAIRAEERLRHFILTGKPMPSSIRMRQIIALRFASDEEFVALAARVASENLSPKEIKQAVKSWRADHHRA